MKGPPTLSPDGSLVAFSWSGPPDKPDRGIYIKSVDGEELRWLTSRGTYPAWSPDGREIAFSRIGENPGVFVISQLGGAERKVWGSGTNVAWTPDAATLLIRDRENTQEPFGIFAVSLKTLERRRLTRPSIRIGDWRFAVSPDGKNLAFIRSGIPGLNDIYVVPMAGGEPRRLTDWNAAMAVWRGHRMAGRLFTTSRSRPERVCGESRREARPPAEAFDWRSRPEMR